MRTKMTMGAKLLGGTAALLLLGGIQGYFGLHTAGNFKDEFDKAVNVSTRKALLLDKISVARSDMVSAQRGEILSAYAKDKAGLEQHGQEYQQNGDLVRRAVDETRTLTVTEEGKTLTAQMGADLSQWQPHHDELLRQAMAGHPAEAERIRRDTIAPISDRMAAAIARLRILQSEILVKDKSRIDEENASSHQIALVLLALCLMVAAIVLVVVRGVTRDIRRAVLQFGEGADQVASAAVQVST
jgi:hypothetical protein